ncbi:hypothetical protein ILP97_31735 [Amycolatopsis sp. H6(2020)]|nr:hypothetical protein [Amycolatopsis sp. H6(2020)]
MTSGGGYNNGAWATCVNGNGQFRIKVHCLDSTGYLYDLSGDWRTIQWYPTWSSRNCQAPDLAVGKVIELA